MTDGIQVTNVEDVIAGEKPRLTLAQFAHALAALSACALLGHLWEEHYFGDDGLARLLARRTGPGGRRR